MMMARYGNAMTADEKTVAAVFRKHYIRTKSVADAHNATLAELAGPYNPNAGNAEARRRQDIVDLLRRVEDKGVTSGMRKKAGTGERTYSVHPLDVWGNRRDGWQVNDVYPSRGTITVAEDASDAEIVLALKREGFIDRNIHHKSVHIDGDRDYGFNIEDKNGKPAYELRVRR